MSAVHTWLQAFQAKFCHGETPACFMHELNNTGERGSHDMCSGKYALKK